MNINEIPEVTTLNWKEEEGIVIINTGIDKIILNKTASIIWNMINGIDTIEEIIDELKKQYGEDNSEEYLEEITIQAIQEFVDNKMVILKSTNEFDGWLQYE